MKKGSKHTIKSIGKIKETRKGKKPALGKHWKQSEEAIRKKREIMKGNTRGFQKGHKFWLNKKRLNMIKEKNPAWLGGKSFELYSIDWNESLRRTIRERDNYTCQLCNKPQGDIVHDVHHIGYDKKNCNPNNLITLCHSCNSRVNKNRNYWENYFKNLINI